MKCNICDSVLDNSYENISVCFNCGDIKKINNNKIDYATKKEKIDTFKKNKKYDYLLLELFNLLAGDNDNISILKEIIQCFENYEKDESEVFNNYIFKDEYKIEVIEKALKLNLNADDKNLFILKYQKTLEEFKNKNNEKIDNLNKDINNCKLEIEKINSKKEYVRPSWLEKVLIGSIILLILGLILAFAIDNKITKYVGLAFLFLGTISVLIVSMYMPTTNDTKKRNLLNKRLNEDYQILNDLKQNNQEIEDKTK